MRVIGTYALPGMWYSIAVATADVFREAAFREEAGGYSPGDVDRALHRWAAMRDAGEEVTGQELRTIRFGRELRGYRRADVDAFLEAVADGRTATPVPPPGMGSVLSGSVGSLLLASSFFAVLVGVEQALHGRWVGYVAMAAPGLLAAGLFFLWHRGPPGAHA